MTARHSHEPRRPTAPEPPAPAVDVKSSSRRAGAARPVSGPPKLRARPRGALGAGDVPRLRSREGANRLGRRPQLRRRSDLVVSRQLFAVRPDFLGNTPEALALAAIAAGVSVETWTLPVPSARRPGAPLQAADLLALHLASARATTGSIGSPGSQPPAAESAEATSS